MLVISFSRVSSHILEMGGDIFLRSVTSMGGLGAPRVGNSGPPWTTLCTEGFQLFSPSDQVIRKRRRGQAGRNYSD